MKKTISANEFVDAFEKANRGNNFSVSGRYALFEYLEQLEEDTGEEIELDVIAICCEYSEYTYEEYVKDYGLDKDLSKEEIRKHVEDNSAFIEVNEDRFIIVSF